MSIGGQEKRNQALFIGQDFVKVTGLGPGGIKIAPMADRGSVTSGVQGDTVLEIMAMNAFTITVEFLQTSTSIDDMLELMNTVGFIPVKYEYGRYNVQGIAVINNEGEMDGSQGGNLRTVILGFARQQGGNTGAGVVLVA